MASKLMVHHSLHGTFWGRVCWRGGCFNFFFFSVCAIWVREAQMRRINTSLRSSRASCWRVTRCENTRRPWACAQVKDQQGSEVQFKWLGKAAPLEVFFKTDGRLLLIEADLVFWASSAPHHWASVPISFAAFAVRSSTVLSLKLTRSPSG